ncbi:thiol-disulfide oxidoreductase DCC family protein [Lentibacillus kimchii]|uniref:Thiol-disulfide oxidoreductase DCC family protein n=1 Tax=Lentibacillus kimchii TaxID=1542911 RepID=A0ABW2UVX6_9BACI
MKHTVFYDARCPLCSSVKWVVGKLDWFRRIRWIPVQDAENNNDYSFLKNRDIYDRIQMLSSKGRIYEGFYTIRKILTLLPVTFPVSWLFYLPYIDRILSPLYMWVSRNRYHWFGRQSYVPQI